MTLFIASYVPQNLSRPYKSVDKPKPQEDQINIDSQKEAPEKKVSESKEKK